jgi:hypothetical protein
MSFQPLTLTLDTVEFWSHHEKVRLLTSLLPFQLITLLAGCRR